MTRCGLLVILALAACAPRVAPIPPEARAQAPGAAAPAGPWSTHGRLAITWPRHHVEMDCFLRRERGQRLRYALVADGGISLAEGALPRQPGEPAKVHPDLAGHLADLERLLAEACLVAAPADPAWDGAVRRDEVRLDTGSIPGRSTMLIATRWYGGDPVLLRRVEGGGWPLEIGDYRTTPLGLMAHHVRADGPWGAEIVLRLDTVQAQP